jgi:hypothetical protein
MIALLQDLDPTINPELVKFPLETTQSQDIFGFVTANYPALLQSHHDASMLVQNQDLITCSQALVSSVREKAVKLNEFYNTEYQDLDMYQSIQKHQLVISEIIGIPRLFDTLIANESFEEAMDLQVHLQRLCLLYPDVKLFHLISRECEPLKTRMLTSITRLLGGKLKLPLLIRVVGYLRRMQNIREPELASCFLKQRNAYLESCLSNIHETDPSLFLRHYIDITRECLFDIVTNFNAIFSESGDPEIANILSSYCTCRINAFTAALSKNLHHDSVLISHIQSIMNQAMYFGSSLARIGLDFRPLLDSIFENAVKDRIFKIMDAAHSVYVENGVVAKNDQEIMHNLPLGILTLTKRIYLIE